MAGNNYTDGGVAMSQYPEHDKLQSIQEESQVIGEFLETCGYQLCEYHQGFLEGGDGASGFMPVRGTIQDILAAHFGIDQKKLDDEKRQMLEELRTT